MDGRCYGRIVRSCRRFTGANPRRRRREKKLYSRAIYDQLLSVTRRRPRVVAPDASPRMGVVTGALFVRVGVLPARIERARNERASARRAATTRDARDDDARDVDGDGRRRDADARANGRARGRRGRRTGARVDVARRGGDDRVRDVSRARARGVRGRRRRRMATAIERGGATGAAATTTTTTATRAAGDGDARSTRARARARTRARARDAAMIWIAWNRTRTGTTTRGG